MVLLGKGDKRAFDEVYARYAKPLFGYFMKLLARDNEKCEDMVHDLFAKIIRKTLLVVETDTLHQTSSGDS